MNLTQNFNWSELDRNSLLDLLYLLKDKIVKIRLSNEEFHKIVTCQIRKYLPLRTKKGYYPDKKIGPPAIAGCYYSDYDHYREKSIEIIILYNQKNTHIEYTHQSFLRFCTVFADTVLHEIIHMRQYRKRRFKALPDYASTAKKTKQREEQQYLGNSDEIDAYSFNIACELTDKFQGHKPQIIQHLNKNQKGTRCRADCWLMYLKAFNHDHNHRIIKRVKKRVTYYLNRSQIDKPFQKKDWITH
jgi:hypothetical protein